MNREEALVVLGIGPDADAAAVRAAYLAAALTLHPDRPDAPADANDRMAQVNRAYETLQGAGTDRSPGGHEPGSHEPGNHEPGNHDRGTGGRGADQPRGAGADDVYLGPDGALLVDAPAEETFFRLAEAVEAIGEVTFIDRGAGLLQVMTEAAPGQFCYLTCSLQGRATGTEIFTSLEALGAAGLPPIGPLLAALADALRVAVW